MTRFENIYNEVSDYLNDLVDWVDNLNDYELKIYNAGQSFLDALRPFVEDGIDEYDAPWFGEIELTEEEIAGIDGVSKNDSD